MKNLAEHIKALPVKKGTIAPLDPRDPAALMYAKLHGLKIVPREEADWLVATRVNRGENVVKIKEKILAVVWEQVRDKGVPVPPPNGARGMKAVLTASRSMDVAREVAKEEAVKIETTNTRESK